jgi:hypothetical protein
VKLPAIVIESIESTEDVIMRRPTGGCCALRKERGGKDGLTSWEGNAAIHARDGVASVPALEDMSVHLALLQRFAAAVAAEEDHPGR